MQTINIMEGKQALPVVNEMEELIGLLKDVRDDVDFENCEDLIDGKILSSFDIIQIISDIDDEFDVAIPATEIVPANFNSVKAIYAMIERLRNA